LSFQGGPTTQDAAQILLREAVTALLNASNPAIGYPLSTSQVISLVNAALATENRDAMLALAALLDQYNNLEGPVCGGTNSSLDGSVSCDDVLSILRQAADLSPDVVNACP
jgi:hypothetical protein